MHHGNMIPWGLREFPTTMGGVRYYKNSSMICGHGWTRVKIEKYMFQFVAWQGQSIYTYIYLYISICRYIYSEYIYYIYIHIQVYTKRSLNANAGF